MGKCGADGGTRTRNRPITSRVRYQLRHVGIRALRSYLARVSDRHGPREGRTSVRRHKIVARYGWAAQARHAADAVERAVAKPPTDRLSLRELGAGEVTIAKRHAADVGVGEIGPGRGAAPELDPAKARRPERGQIQLDFGEHDVG
jgi:hypothetical protein